MTEVKNKPARTKTPQTGVKKTNQNKKPWWKIALSAVAMLAWVLISVVASQLLLGYLMIWMIGLEAFQQPVASAVYSALSYLLAMALIIFVPPKISVAWKIVNEKKDDKKLINGKVAPKAADREELGFRGWPTWTDIGLAPVGLVVYLLLAAGIAAIFSCFPWFDASEAQDVGFNILYSGVDRVVAFLTLVVVAPIAEETIFRGWLYGKLRAKFSERMSNVGGMILAILLVSVAFGVLHGQWNVGIDVFALSVVLCALREITGTVYAGILLHMLKNGIAFFLLYVLGIT